MQSVHIPSTGDHRGRLPWPVVVLVAAAMLVGVIDSLLASPGTICDDDDDCTMDEVCDFGICVCDLSMYECCDGQSTMCAFDEICVSNICECNLGFVDCCDDDTSNCQPDEICDSNACVCDLGSFECCENDTGNCESDEICDSNACVCDLANFECCENDTSGCAPGESCVANACAIACTQPSDCPAGTTCDGAMCISDCNSNGTPDATDIADGTSQNCNNNIIPDECDIAAGTSPDCNSNGIPDGCEISVPITDCNDNGILDVCEPDCDGDGTIDACDSGLFEDQDCNANNVPDNCDLLAGTSTNCNNSIRLDVCEIAAGTASDCNSNALPDECDLAVGTSTDCNTNGIPDACDIRGATSDDCDSNGLPDACDVSGVRQLYFAGWKENLLYRLDPLTGTPLSTLITAIPGIGRLVTRRGMDTHPVTGDVWMLLTSFESFASTETAVFSVLVKINICTGRAVVVAEVDAANRSRIFRGLAFNASGTRLFTMESESLVLTNLVEIEPANGAVTSLTALTPRAPFSNPGAGALALNPDDGLLYRIADTDLFESVDTNGVAVTPIAIGATGVFKEPEGMTFDPDRGAFLFAGSDAVGPATRRLYELTPAGALTVIGPTVPTSPGGLTFATCQADCSTNGTPDDCDIADGVSTDCDSNGVPDECELIDCNTNDVHDACEIGGLYGLHQRTDQLSLLNPNDINALTAVPIDATTNGDAESGGDGLAVHPLTGHLWAILRERVDSMSRQRLVRIDRFSGRVTSVGLLNPQIDFVGLAFNADGSILFATSGHEATMNDMLFTLDQVTAAETLVGSFTSGAFGVALACNPVDGRLYRPVGFDGLTTLMDALDPSSLALANIGVSGDLFGGPNSMTYSWQACGFLMNAVNFPAIDAAAGGPVLLSDNLPEGELTVLFDLSPAGVSSFRTIVWGDYAGLAYVRTEADCDANGVIDSCENFDDCNANGVPDACDLADGTSADCNGNCLPDECDIVAETSADCNSNVVPDECDLGLTLDQYLDCVANPAGDTMEIPGATSNDCNHNLIPDECDIAAGTSQDCNGNAVPDICDLTARTSPDCNTNAVPDECDIAGETSTDCNSNGRIDACEIADLAGCHFVNRVAEASVSLPFTPSRVEGPPNNAGHSVLGGEFIVFEFLCTPIVDGPGPDLTVYEIPFGPAEFDTIDVFVSTNGTDFVSVTDTGTAGVTIPGDEANPQPDFRRSYDIAGTGFDAANFVAIQRIADPPAPVTTGSVEQLDRPTRVVEEQRDPVIHGDNPFAFELDAVGVIHIEPLDPDCNTNAVPDSCDIAGDTSADCNSNAVPDECDIAAGTSTDCNSNGVPDTCDLAADTSVDCNGNMVPDECDLGFTLVQFVTYQMDEMFEGIFIAHAISTDCNLNFIPDDCDIAGATSEDCNSNTFPDECDIREPEQSFCCQNPDKCGENCEIVVGTSQDCNDNSVPDECDIRDGTSPDTDLSEVPDECQVAARVDAAEKGSALFFPYIQLTVDPFRSVGGAFADTFITLSNDYNLGPDVRVQMYFISGDTWEFADADITLTPDQPAYWSAWEGRSLEASGLNFDVLPAVTLPDGTVAIRGSIIAFAVNANGEEIRWNHLSGSATVVDYVKGTAWTYTATTFTAHKNVPHGAQTGTPGVINLDGFEFEAPPAELVFNFFAPGAEALSAVDDMTTVTTETALTLMPVGADFTVTNGIPGSPIATLARYVIFNENENKKTNTRRCVTCWDTVLLDQFENPNWFLAANLGTDMGKASVDGEQSVDCDIDFDPNDNKALGEDYRDILSEAAALLGVVVRHLDFGNGNFDAAGYHLTGRGAEAAMIRFPVGPGGGTDEAPTDETQPADDAAADLELIPLRPFGAGERVPR